jgi:hypothetical protein
MSASLAAKHDVNGVWKTLVFPLGYAWVPKEDATMGIVNAWICVE